MVFSLGAFLLSSGAGPTLQPARADVDSISVNTIDGENNDIIEITVVAEDNDGDLVVSTTSGDLDVTDCDVPDDGLDCTGAEVGGGGDTITLDTDAIDGNATQDELTMDLDLTLDCTDGQVTVVTITADQGNDESVTVVCGFTGPNITIEKEADGNDDTFDFDFDVSSGEDCAVFKDGLLVDEGDSGDFSLDDDEEAALYCDADATVEIVENDDGDFSEIEDTDNCGAADSWIDISDATVTIDLDDLGNDTVTCNFRNEGGLTPTATATPVGGTAATVTVSAAPASITTCGGSSFVTVVVKDAAGVNVADGTIVTISPNLGSVSPSTTTTVGGGVLVVYTAPTNTGGTATITATSGSRSGNAQIELLCLTATATPVPTQVPSVIQPPSTGDAGLVEDGSGWTGYAGILLIAAALLGTAAVARKRA